MVNDIQKKNIKKNLFNRSNKEGEYLSFRRLAIFGVAILTIVAINSLWYLPIKRELNNNSVRLFETIADNAGTRVSEFINIHANEIDNLAHSLSTDPDSISESLARLFRENLAVDSVSLIGLSGQELIRRDRTQLITAGDLRFRLSDTAFRYSSEGSKYVGSVFISAEGDPSITMAIPLNLKSNNLAEEIAVLSVDINIRFLVNVIRDIRFGNTGLVYVFDSSGFLISHPNTSLVIQRLNLLDREIVQNTLAGKSANTLDISNAYKNFNGFEVFAVGLPIEIGGGWGVVAEQSAEEASTSQSRAFAAAVLSIIIEIIFAVFLYGLYINLLRTTIQLESEKTQREAILNSLSDGVLEYDAKSRIILMNPSAEKLMGVKFDDVSNLVITPDVSNVRPELRNLVGVMYPALALYASGVKEIVGSNAKMMEVYLSDNDVKLLVTLTQVKDSDGKIIGFLKILHDISREKLFARLRSEFVSIAAHQLRTPLSAIKWTLRLLLDEDIGELSQEQKDLLKRGYDTNERMIKLVSDLLNAARIEEGRFGYEFKNTNIRSFIKGILEGAELEAKSRNIKLEFEDNATKNELPPLFVDPEKLSLALNNIIDNAIKYSFEKGIVYVNLEKKGGYVEISVRDKGVGIPKAEQNRIFSRFFRASNVIKMDTDGTGLGLFIVNNIIKRHGGSISFKSQENKGTTFLISIPLNKEDIPTEENAPSEEFLEAI